MASLIISSCQNKIEQDIVVIGGGLMGSATAWELSKHRQNVLLKEHCDFHSHILPQIIGIYNSC